MLLPFEEETYTAIDPAWTLKFDAKTADGPVDILEPDSSWIPNQRYCLNYIDFTTLDVSVLHNGEVCYSVELLPKCEGPG